MPWDVSDVEKFNKSLNAMQKRRWVAIANSIFKDCKKNDSSGSFGDCEAKAIILSNKIFKDKRKED